MKRGNGKRVGLVVIARRWVRFFCVFRNRPRSAKGLPFSCRGLAEGLPPSCRNSAEVCFFLVSRGGSAGVPFSKGLLAPRGVFFVRPPRVLRLSRLSRNQPLDTRDEILAIGAVVVAERQRPRARRKVYRLRLHLRVDSREIVAAVRNIQAFARVAHP